MRIDEKREILKCFPTYCVDGVRVGDVMMVQHVLAKYRIDGMQAKMMLDELVADGYLMYDDGINGKVAGWHLTQKGFDILYM